MEKVTNKKVFLNEKCFFLQVKLKRKSLLMKL